MCRRCRSIWQVAEAMRASRILCALVCCASVWCEPAAAQIVSVSLQPTPRSFGRFVGDLLTSTAVIAVRPGTVLDTRSLPAVGPVSAIADVRQVRVSGTPDRVEIQVTYQEFFAPGQVMRAELPGYTLTFSAKDMRFSAAVPGFGFVASPFRDDLQPTLDPAQMRPDHAALQAEAPGAVRLMLGGLVLIVIGLALFIRALPLASRRQPFAAVAARFARASRRANTSASETERDILLAMHRAFDASAGKPVLAEDVDDFLFVPPAFLAATHAHRLVFRLLA